MTTRPHRTRRLRKALAGLGAVGIAAALGAGPAVACGDLVGENGSIELVRTTTLAAYHGGIERYVTSFEFTGEGEEVGSIIPLPDVPSNIERGGDWTLQRLQQEIAPPAEEGDAVAASAEVDAGALDYDLAVSTDDDEAPKVVDAGIPAREAVPVDATGDGITWWPVAIGVAAAAAVLGGGLLVRLMAAPPMPAVGTRTPGGQP